MALPAHSCGAGGGRGGGSEWGRNVGALRLCVTGMWAWHVSVSVWELCVPCQAICCEGDCVFVFHVFA